MCSAFHRRLKEIEGEAVPLPYRSLITIVSGPSTISIQACTSSVKNSFCHSAAGSVRWDEDVAYRFHGGHKHRHAAQVPEGWPFHNWCCPNHQPVGNSFLLQEWNDDRDALQYPPAEGRYSVYDGKGIFEHLAFIVDSVSGSSALDVLQYINKSSLKANTFILRELELKASERSP